MNRAGKNVVHSIVLAAALAAGLPAAAAGAERCATGGRASVSYGGGEPYQRTRHRVADDPQYRLQDSGQYRLAGAASAAGPCLRPGAAGGRFIVAPGYEPSAGRGAYHALINATAKAANIQADLLHAVIAVESGYDYRALSPKGAQGLMQLMPDTARLYTVSNPYDPAQNVRAGARHLRYLLGEFDNDLALALAAYNAGAEAVRRYRNSIPPYPETRDYVQRVIQLYRRRLNH